MDFNVNDYILGSDTEESEKDELRRELEEHPAVKPAKKSNPQEHKNTINKDLNEPKQETKPASQPEQKEAPKQPSVPQQSKEQKNRVNALLTATSRLDPIITDDHIPPKSPEKVKKKLKRQRKAYERPTGTRNFKSLMPEPKDLLAEKVISSLEKANEILRDLPKGKKPKKSKKPFTIMITPEDKDLLKIIAYAANETMTEYLMEAFKLRLQLKDHLRKGTVVTLKNKGEEAINVSLF